MTTLPAGYKQTEIGVIPEDWKIDSFESLTPLGKKYGIVDGPFGSNLKTEHYRKSGIPIVTSGYVTSGVFVADEYLYVDEEKFKQEKRSAVHGGDIVMAKIGANCGATAILPKNHPESILSGNALKISIDEKRHSNIYIWQVMWSLYKNGSFDSIRSTGAQPAVSMANLKKYKIPLPTKTEQQAIATTLSDIDALIESLEKLIAKKRQIKQGAMQELLTGKKRLAGFSEKWKIKKIGDISTVGRGRVISHREINPLIQGKYPVYSSQTSNNGVMGYINTFDFEGEYVTWTTDGEKAGTVFYRNGQFNCTNVCGTIKLKTDNPKFIAMILGTIAPKFVSRNLANPKLMNDPMKKIEIPLPTVSEQIAIATILSDMDTEISTLESRLAKTRTIKSGMMHELLTGRIRLI